MEAELMATDVEQAEQKWIEAIHAAGSKQITVDGVPQGYTAREQLARVLWLAAVRGDLRASTLVLKYDLGLGGEDVAPALVPDEVTDALGRAYGGTDEEEDVRDAS